MPDQAFRDKLYELSMTAGTNQRYHSAKLGRFKKWDWVTKLALGVVAVLGAVCTILGHALESSLYQLIGPVSLGSALLTLITLGFSDITPFQKRVRTYQDLLDRWCGLRKKINTFDVDVQRVDGPIPDHFFARLKELTSEKDDINAREKEAADEDLLELCLVKEERARGVDVELPSPKKIFFFPSFGASRV